MYLKRKLEIEIKKLAKEFPIVAILGPRQSGKTTMAKHVFKKHRYISLEDPDTRSFALEDPRGFLKEYNKDVIIDEIQRVPELFSYLQTHSDLLDKVGSFILTGSQNYLLSENISQSLAGRVGITTLLPFSYDEIRDYNKELSLEDLILKGFYPRIYDHEIRPISFYKSYLSTYIEKDIRMIKNIQNYNLFYKFIKLLAGRTGQVLNTLNISEQCGISHNTVKEWLSILETSYIIYRLLPFHKNYNKRLIKSPKIYFYDTGLLCYLLGVSTSEHLNLYHNKGSIFENFVISEFIKNSFNKSDNRNFYFWRDNHNREIDLIIEEGASLKAIEIKSSHTFRGNFLDGLLYWSALTNNPNSNSYLVYAGDLSYNKEDINITTWANIINI